MLLPPPGQTRYSTHLRGRDKPHVAGSVGGWGSGRPALGCWAAERWSGPRQLVPRLTPHQSPAPARRRLLLGHRDSLGWHTSPEVIIKVQTIQCIKTSYTWQNRWLILSILSWIWHCGNVLLLLSHSSLSLILKFAMLKPCQPEACDCSADPNQ